MTLASAHMLIIAGDWNSVSSEYPQDMAMMPVEREERCGDEKLTGINFLQSTHPTVSTDKIRTDKSHSVSAESQEPCSDRYQTR
eukprot:1372096-Pleurochrysis_carterae.AAC.1